VSIFDSLKHAQEYKAQYGGEHTPIIRGVSMSADEAVVDGAGKAGVLTVATNAAGRGTNIRPTDPAYINGGLHVIIPFIPLRERTLLQVFFWCVCNSKMCSFSFIYLMSIGRSVSPPDLFSFALWPSVIDDHSLFVFCIPSLTFPYLPLPSVSFPSLPFLPFLPFRPFSPPSFIAGCRAFRAPWQTWICDCIWVS
jgi:hypothetical protein